MRHRLCPKRKNFSWKFCSVFRLVAHKNRNALKNPSGRFLVDKRSHHFIIKISFSSFWVICKKNFTLLGWTGLARFRSGRDRAQLSQPDRAVNRSGQPDSGWKKSGRAGRPECPPLVWNILKTTSYSPAGWLVTKKPYILRYKLFLTKKVTSTMYSRFLEWKTCLFWSKEFWTIKNL